MLQFLRSAIILLAILLMIVTVIVGCGDSDNEKPAPTETVTHPPTTTPPPTTTTPPDTVITIGNLTDFTGVSASAMEYINMALNDMIEYYNENELIPGVEFKIESYDGQMDPAKDIPGYEWLLEKGADLIFTPIPATPTTLKSRVNQDKIVLISMSASREAYYPPGYIFNLGVDSQYEGYTMMKWIAENHWNYESKGPAKVGGAAWSEAHSDNVLAAMEEYCNAHPDQFEWVGGYLTHFSMNWQSEVEALKDCDYIYPGIVFLTFVQQFREAGYTKAKFVGSDTQAAFFDMVDAANLWDEIDGMLFLKVSRWWNEDGEIVDLVKQLLHQKHPDRAETVIQAGVGYMAGNQIYAMFQIIADAAATVGPENLDSQAIYDAATSFSLSTDGVQRLSFTEDKRDAVDAYGMYEARTTEQDIFRVQEDWIPTVRSP